MYLRVSISVVSFKWLDCDLILWLICPKSVLFAVKLCLISNVLSVATGGLLKVRLSMLVVLSAIQNLNDLKRWKGGMGEFPYGGYGYSKITKHLVLKWWNLVITFSGIMFIFDLFWYLLK